MIRFHFSQIILALVLFIFLVACNDQTAQEIVASPDGKIKLITETRGGQLYYAVFAGKELIVDYSIMGFKFKNMPQLGNNVRIINTQRNSVNTTWEQPWGEKRLIENRYEELILTLKENNSNKREMIVYFRIFNDGLGFRYFLNEQDEADSLIIMDELTQFNLVDVDSAWWIPAYDEVFYESLYRHTPLSQMDTASTPVTFELSNGKCVAIHEANLTDYAGLNIFPDRNGKINTDLTPWSGGEKVRAKPGMYTPWRTITIANNPGGLITSYISLNLNEPCQFDDMAWIKPGKYIGIWWAIHLGKYTWDPGINHGATTANVKEYMDFAADNGFSGVLVEGWNKGWHFDWTRQGDQISFTEPYPDFNMKEITTYARLKGVKLIGHHETGGAVNNYEAQLEDAFKYYNQHGVSTVKTGYVSQKLNGKEYHSSQYGVRHYRRVLETAAKYQIMINNHEPAMPTGLRRTFPNLMTGEGVRGNEYNAWSADGGNPPEHTTVVPFTRGLAGPMDFTFGTFNFDNPKVPGTRVQSTIAKQLALYVVIYSPMQMASDLPENYKKKKEFDFIKAVPVDWSETKVIDAEIGNYTVVARKDRHSEEWYVGCITDEISREVEVPLGFLDHNKSYLAQIYSDGPKADWKNNPTDFQYYEKTVTNSDTLHIKMARGGGQAIRLLKE